MLTGMHRYWISDLARANLLRLDGRWQPFPLDGDHLDLVEFASLELAQDLVKGTMLRNCFAQIFQAPDAY